MNMEVAAFLNYVARQETDVAQQYISKQNPRVLIQTYSMAMNSSSLNCKNAPRIHPGFWGLLDS